MGVRVREKQKESGIWRVFVNHEGKRKAKKIGRDKRLAADVAKKVEAKLALGEFHMNQESKEVLFKDYALQWLNGYTAASLKYSTYRGYRNILNRHLLPQFGNQPLNGTTREEIKNFLFKKMNEGLSHGTVRNLKSAISGIFTQAFEDGHVPANPASRLGKILNAKDQHISKDISPFSAAELESYLEACQTYYPDAYPLFLTLARTGMRLGEALGLQWGDIDFAARFIEVKRGWVENRVTTPKNGKIRRVDMSPQLTETLTELLLKRKRVALKKGWGEVPTWVFVNHEGKPLDPGNLRGRIHYRICEKAGLRRIRIHDLRHSYATIRISSGHNLPDVSRQLGHCSIKITVDTYYHWIPNERRLEVAELDKLGKRPADKGNEVSQFASPKGC